jgi:hypothetical protein
VAKVHGEPHLSNTAQGKRRLFTYDGHARDPGVAHEIKRERARRRRRLMRAWLREERDRYAEIGV